jgi:hypothetical protein
MSDDKWSRLKALTTRADKQAALVEAEALRAEIVAELNQMPRTTDSEAQYWVHLHKGLNEVMNTVRGALQS